MRVARLNRRKFVTLAGGAIAWPLAAGAQERPRLVGAVMGIADDAEGQRRIAEFQKGLQDLGWVEGRNIRFDYRWGSGNPDRIRADALRARRPAERGRKVFRRHVKRQVAPVQSQRGDAGILHRGRCRMPHGMAVNSAELRGRVDGPCELAGHARSYRPVPQVSQARNRATTCSPSVAPRRPFLAMRFPRPAYCCMPNWRATASSDNGRSSE